MKGKLCPRHTISPTYSYDNRKHPTIQPPFSGRSSETLYRLWPASQRLEPQRRPELAQVELASLALELAAWGSAALRFVDPPPPGALAAGRDLLLRLDALDATHAITPRGRRVGFGYDGPGQT